MNINEFLEKTGIKIREFIHPELMKILSSKTTGNLIQEGTLPKEQPYLIVANHLCIEDIPTLAQAVQEHFYLLVSDEDKKTLDGVGLSLNGVKWVCRTDKNSRRKISEQIVKTLNYQKSVAMYPEATWNLSPNLLMLPMNYGCIRIALEANVPIIPIVSFFDFQGKERHTIIGNKFYPTNNLKESITNLRDIMATLVWKEMEYYYKKNKNKENIYSTTIKGEEYFYEQRKGIEENYWNNYISFLYDQYQRAKKDKDGVRNFESQFIFTPKTDDHSFFQTFNSIVRYDEKGNPLIKRISSEKNGYRGTTFDEIDFQRFFGYGYNEKVFNQELQKVKKKVK